MKKVLVIIPAYNEELNIKKTVDNVVDYSKKSKYKIDYVVINDGSTDNTIDILDKNNYNYVNLINNLGIGGAVQTGYKYAYYNDYDIAIQFDGDGQHDVNYIDSLVKELNNGADCAIGSRFIGDLSKFKSSTIRRIGIKILSFTIKLCTGYKIYDTTSGFRAVNKNIIKIFALDYPLEYPEPETNAFLIKKGFKLSEIPVKMQAREYGKSSINLGKSVYYMISVSLAIIIATINGEVK